VNDCTDDTLTAYNQGAMADPTSVAQLASRVDRLLLRHQEVLRTNELLTAQVQALTAERDLMRSKLAAARSRIDALLDRLPTAPEAAPTHTLPTHPAP